MVNEQIKIRISSGPATAMGPGKAELLALIEVHGSISAAAKQMKMSYRRAWELVDEVNKCFDQPLVSSSVGGTHGGGAKLTDFGAQVLKNYHALIVKSQEASVQELSFLRSHLK